MFKDILGFLAAKVRAVKRGGATSCLWITCTLCLIPLITIAIVFRLQSSSLEYSTIYIDTQDEALCTVSPNFLSLGLDSTIITERFPHFNMSDPKLVALMKYLSPVFLRIGGNQADQIVFSRNGSLNDGKKPIPESYILSGLDWLKLYKLARTAGFRIIYDLNSLLRNNDGSWNSENAQEMLAFSQENSLTLNWELGNEPNSYPHKFNTSVSPIQLAYDYLTLKEILNNNTFFKGSALVGPSTTRLRTHDIEEYLLEFLIHGFSALDAITFHHYYFSGQNATLEEFLDVNNFDYLKSCIKAVKLVIEQLPIMDKPLWLGETATAWHGGAPNLTNRFVGCFLWLDKLGVSAKMGIEVVIRQSIFKGYYALIDDNYEPNPDWWLSVLYKTLVGPKVLATQTEGNTKIRLYAHCAQENPLWSNTSPVIVFGENFSDRKGYVKIKELRSDENVFVYEFTSDGSLQSQFVQLNGKKLRLESDWKLPDLQPLIKNRTNSLLEMPPYSIVFWVLTNTNVDACSI